MYCLPAMFLRFSTFVAGVLKTKVCIVTDLEYTITFQRCFIVIHILSQFALAEGTSEVTITTSFSGVFILFKCRNSLIQLDDVILFKLSKLMLKLNSRKSWIVYISMGFLSVYALKHVRTYEIENRAVLVNIEYLIY